ncbi:MAG: class I SAM-dependent methyltransferase [Phycisphaeraceae bacterium]|nr:class I SAM-dependent methyltransferase [Phycisphaeraceae bacterium]
MPATPDPSPVVCLTDVFDGAALQSGGPVLTGIARDGDSVTIQFDLSDRTWSSFSTFVASGAGYDLAWRCRPASVYHLGYACFGLRALPVSPTLGTLRLNFNSPSVWPMTKTDPSPTPTSHEGDRTDGLYGQPDLYDILHGPDTEWEVRGLFRIARRFLGPRDPATMRWLEPACGTGRYLRIAAKRGVRVVGFDRSPEMISYAQARMKDLGVSRRANLFVGDMVGFEAHVKPASIDLAFNLINTIRHLPSDRAMLAHLAGIRAVTKPNGVVVVGISLSAYGKEEAQEDIWRGKRGRIEVTQIVNYEPAEDGPGKRKEMVYSHMLVRGPKGDAHFDDAYGLRSYDLRQWREITSRAGLECIAVIDEQGQDIEIREPGYAIHAFRAKPSP